MVDEVGRRRFLEFGGGAAATMLAGCLGDDDSNGYETDTPTDTPEPEISYDLEVTEVTHADYSDLDIPTGEPINLEELRQNQDHGQIQYAVKEYLDGEEVDELEPDTLQVELNGTTGTVDELDQIEYTDDGTLQINYSDLLNGENNITLQAQLDGETYTAETTVQKKDPREEHGEKRTEYREETARESDYINLVEWIDQNIDELRVDEDADSDYPYFQRQVGMIASRWVDEMPIAATSEYAEELAMALEYAGEEHLDIDIQAGAIGNMEPRGQHKTVIVRNSETEELWHTDTNGGRTLKPERFAQDNRYTSALNYDKHGENTAFAEMMGSAFTRIEELSQTAENLRHTDETLSEIARLKRADGDFSTMEQTSIEAVMLAEKYDDLHFEIGVATDTPDEVADLEITAQPAT